MVVLAWGFVVLAVVGWWVFRLDSPDRDPFKVARIYRLVVGILLVLVIVLGYKSVVWNRDLRSLILDTCR
jgi:hypothetical protein